MPLYLMARDLELESVMRDWKGTWRFKRRVLMTMVMVMYSLSTDPSLGGFLLMINALFHCEYNPQKFHCVHFVIQAAQLLYGLDYSKCFVGLTGITG